MANSKVKKKTAGQSASGRTKLIIWLIAAAVLIGAVVAVAILVTRDDDAPPAPPPATATLEECFAAMKDAGHIASYFVYEERHLAEEEILKNGFDGRLVAGISGQKDEKSVTVYELESEAEAARASGVISEWLGEAVASKTVGRFLVFGDGTLVELVELD